MLRTKVEKGKFSYLHSKTIQVLVQTLILFGISILIFVCGYIYKGTKANAMTIVAVLGLLPASKSLVSLIMYLKTPKYNVDIYKRLNEIVDINNGLYELYFTSYSKNFPVSTLICKKDSIIGFTEFEKFEDKAFEEHLSTILKQNSFKDINIKIFKDINKFEERAKQVVNQNDSEALKQLILQITL